MKTVADILNKKKPPFNMVDADMKVADALSIMKTYDHNYIIVLRNGLYAGIFTERDFAQKVLMMGKIAQVTPVGEVMSINLPTVSSEDTVQECMMLMNAYKTRHLPVYDEFQFKDVISMIDLIRINMNKEDEALVSFSSDKIF